VAMRGIQVLRDLEIEHEVLVYRYNRVGAWIAAAEVAVAMHEIQLLRDLEMESSMPAELTQSTPVSESSRIGGRCGDAWDTGAAGSRDRA